MKLNRMQLRRLIESTLNEQDQAADEKAIKDIQRIVGAKVDGMYGTETEKAYIEYATKRSAGYRSTGTFAGRKKDPKWQQRLILDALQDGDFASALSQLKKFDKDHPAGGYRVR